MGETRRKYDPEFREGAVRIVRETGKSIAEVAGDLDLNPGTLGNWVKNDQIERGEAERSSLLTNRSLVGGKQPGWSSALLATSACEDHVTPRG